MIESRRPERAGPPVRVVTLPTEIDVSNADRVGEELIAALAPGVQTVVADMTDTTFCDSSGVSMLVQAQKRASSCDAELRVVARSTAVLRSLTLVRIDYLLRVYPSLSAALAADSARAPAPDPLSETRRRLPADSGRAAADQPDSRGDEQD